MSKSPRSDAMREAIGRVLAENASDHPADLGVIADFVMVAEIIGIDGEPYIYTLRNADGTAWRQIGMLTVSLDEIRDRLRDQGE